MRITHTKEWWVQPHDLPTLQILVLLALSSSILEKTFRRLQCLRLSRYHNQFNSIGMQFVNVKPYKCPSLYRICILLAFITLGPPAAVLALALGAVGVIIGLPALIYVNTSCYQRTCCEFLMLPIVCVVLSPISVVVLSLGLAFCLAVGAIGIIPYGIYCLVDWCRYRWFGL